MTDNSSQEGSRKYVQWKEEEISLLLDDLEKPESYAKWRINKTGYAKKVSEQIFNGAMNYETIKFKIRWLEIRYKYWDNQLKEENEDRKVILGKMSKEFPYYDRCKTIFEAEDPNALNNNIIIMKPETASDISNTPSPKDYTKRPQLIDLSPKKRRKHNYDSLDKEYNLKVLEIELEYKKMDHQERMQEMKIEELKLEIELEKLKKE